MPNPNRPTRSPSIPIPTPSRRNIEDILNISNLTPPLLAGAGLSGTTSGPSTSPQRERSQSGRWTPAMNPNSRFGSLMSPGRGVGGASSTAVPSGTASPSNAGVGSWNGTRNSASWTPRSVSSSAAVSSGSRPMSHFEPRVIRPDGTQRAGEQPSSVHAGLSASRPQAQRRESNAGATSASPSRARRSSTTPVVTAGVGGRSGSVPGSPALSQLHGHSQSVSASRTRSPISSTQPQPPAPTPFLRPQYITYSALRDIIHTDESASAALNQGLLRGASLARPVVPLVPPRRDFTPLSDSDDDSDAYGGRLQRTNRERGRTRDPTAAYYASSISQSLHSDPILRLPSRWSEQERHKYLSVDSDGRTLQYNGATSQGEKDAAAARANYSIPPACGIFYYEVTILDKGLKGHISIGFSTQTVRLNRLPGWERDSWGYHGDDGNSFASEKSGTQFGPRFHNGNVVGCGIDFTQHKVFYTVDGRLIGHVFENVGRDHAIYPSVGLRTQNESIRANFGQEPFRYDINTHIHDVQERVWEKIQSTVVKWTIDDSADVFKIEAENKSNGASGASSGAAAGVTTTQEDASVKNEADNSKGVKQEPQDDDYVPLVLPPDYQEPLNKLILSYLTHHGYEKTAQAFQAQAQAAQERKAQLLQSSRKPGSAVPTLNIETEQSIDVKMEEDEDCPQLSDVLHVDDGPFDLEGLGTEKKDDDFHSRQRIVNAVYSGDIDLAIDLAHSDCPQVLCRDNGIMLFKLRCRKFVELILLSSEAGKKMKRVAQVAAKSTAVDSTLESKEDGAMDVDDEGGQFTGVPVNGFANGTSASTHTPDDQHRQEAENSLAVARAEYQAVLNNALVYGRQLQDDHKMDMRPEVQTLLKRTFSLVMYEDPMEVGGEVAEVASVGARSKLAQELNQAILESQGRRSRPALERLYRQTSAVIAQLAMSGVGEAAFADMQKEFLD